MCERCEAVKEELWAEVRDLLEFHSEERGPLSKALARRVDEIMSEAQFHVMAFLSNMDATDEAKNEAVEAMRCMMISQRLAVITMFGNSARGGTAPSIVMGEWAGDLMGREMAVCNHLDDFELSPDGAPQMKFVRAILGELIGDPENAEYEDD